MKPAFSATIVLLFLSTGSGVIQALLPRPWTDAARHWQQIEAGRPITLTALLAGLDWRSQELDFTAVVPANGTSQRKSRK